MAKAKKKATRKARLIPVTEPRLFAPGDRVIVDGREYIVQQNQVGEHQVMVTNPDFQPGGSSPRFLFFSYTEVEGHAEPGNPEP